MSGNKSSLRLVLGILLFCVLPILACNFPFPMRSPGQPLNLQNTLTAMAVQQPEIETPIPDHEEDQSSNVEDLTPIAQAGITSVQKPEPPLLDADGNYYTYQSQPGDTLLAVAKRFGVETSRILISEPLQEEVLLPPGTELAIPNQLGDPSYAEILLPDSEVVNSPSTLTLNIKEFINDAGGYLNEHQEMVNGRWMSGVDIVTKVSFENSINPRLLLALLEMRSGWVYGDLVDSEQLAYPVGFYVPDYKGLYYELVLTATHLGVGYYGWRSGDKVSLSFQDGGWLRLGPGLNPGTVALQTMLSKISTRDEWQKILYADNEFSELYARMFGDPWSRTAISETLLPADLVQPELELPFLPGERWSFTGGPHRSWNAGSPRGALDFSPVTGEPACTTSRAWVTASASGVITRVGDNVLALDLDGDGQEQTGWVLVYLHIVTEDDTLVGKSVAVDDQLGHPSCERGNSTGTHVHIARKYNGEWIPAGEPIPFTLGGWETQVGQRNYQGSLTKGDQTIIANPGGPSSSLIIRED